MKRPPVLAMISLGLPCLLAVCPAGPAIADHRQGDPYEICRDRGLDTVEFNRCISDVYIEEVRRADTVGELERALRGRGGTDELSELRRSPCLFNPATGRYQECRMTAAGDQCLQYAGPCVP